MKLAAAAIVFMSFYPLNVAAQKTRTLSVQNIGPNARPADRPVVEGHWGEESVGFSWKESDSVDGRWSQTDVGPFLASVLQTPGGMIAKGLSIKLYIGSEPKGAVAYDTQSMSCRVAWTGGFLKFDPARYGVINAPSVNPSSVNADSGPFVLQKRDSWGDADVQYRGMFQNGHSVVLQYDVNGIRVLEIPSIMLRGGQAILQRDFEVVSPNKPLMLHVPQHTAVASESSIVFRDGNDPVIVISGGNQNVRFTTFSGRDESVTQFPFPTSQNNIQQLMKPGELLWPEVLRTVGIVASVETSEPFAVDTITLPFNNPYKALMFVGGHDFFSDGSAALCTLHGDVWTVDGLDAKLQDVTWKRFATGLHQPLGLRIVDDQIYVLGRDQITRLHDRDKNGEADCYECFNNAGQTSTGGHDYAAGLETDADGNFYYVRARTGVVKVAADGQSEKIVAAGLRNPAGLGVSANGAIAVSPQEGEWTPASAIFDVQPGNWFGYGGPKANDRRPLGYDPPLCWIPRRVDNSTGGQTWVTSDLWTPLKDQLLTFSFGRCSILLTLRDEFASATQDENRIVQGGVVPLGLDFESGLLRGRFHPIDQQLYVSGMTGWLSSATRDGCFQRVRYSGQPLNLPTELKVYENGLGITFTDPLDPASVRDQDNFQVQQWNYRYSSAYGSDEYRVSSPNQPGRDDVELLSSSLSEDGRTVMLEMADVQPVMQMQVSYSLRSEAGKPIQSSIFNTINNVPQRRMEPKLELVAAVEKPGRLDREVRKRLKPGLVARFRQPSSTGTLVDVRHVRRAALSVTANESVSSRLTGGPASFTMSGYLRSRLKGNVRFWVEGPSEVLLKIDGKAVETGKIAADDLSAPQELVGVSLARGYNRIEISGELSGKTDCRFRLLWSSDDVLPEPIPSAALLYDSENPELVAADELRDSRAVFAASRCIRCHAIPRMPTSESAMPELYLDAPRLKELGQRLQSNWVAHWLFEPRTLRPQATMPHMLSSTDEGRAEAIHLAAYLSAHRTESDGEQAKTANVDDPKTNEAFLASELIERGLELYETRGCMACHRFTPPSEGDDYDRISLHFASEKFRPKQLATFLQQPHENYQSIRMPDFGFDASEAAAIAAYLRSQSTGELKQLADVKPDRTVGEKLFVERRCNQCHLLDANELAAAPYGTLFQAANRRGCLAESDALRGASPDFGFDDAERARLLRFLHGSDATLRVHVKGEVATRTIERLRCLSCHDQDETYSSLPDITADEGELGLPYERLPNLGFAGGKLQSDWIRRQIAGKLEYRSRPWLKMRMPAFPHYAELLTAGLAAEHGVVVDEQFKDEQIDEQIDELVLAGRQLSTKEKGFDCLQCHSLGDDFIELENKANGVGLAYVTDRLRKNYYHRWIRDPLRIDPLTKMPKFTTDGVKSQRTEYFAGDAQQQFEALWLYMHQLEIERESGRESKPRSVDEREQR